jgi:outer membrane biosynthesis protein TonB
MDLESRAPRQLRSITALVAALVVHVTLALASPGGGVADLPVASAGLVWMEGTAVGQGCNAEVATSAVPTSPASRPTRRGRTRANGATPRREHGGLPATTSGESSGGPSAGLPSTGIATTAGTAADHATPASHDGQALAAATASAPIVSAHGPALRPAGSSCSADFPARARVDHGEVQVIVDVDAAGHAHVRSVLLEHPHGQGFGSAARSCAEHLHFDPAIDVRGAPVSGHAKLRLRFDRLSPG